LWKLVKKNKKEHDIWKEKAAEDAQRYEDKMKEYEANASSE
jgi:hypothetical protein